MCLYKKMRVDGSDYLAGNGFARLTRTARYSLGYPTSLEREPFIQISTTRYEFATVESAPATYSSRIKVRTALAAEHNFSKPPQK